MPVSGASSYSAYEEGIEIEIDTKEEYRRKGLEAVCGAKLILECLKRGLYPPFYKFTGLKVCNPPRKRAKPFF